MIYYDTQIRTCGPRFESVYSGPSLAVTPLRGGCHGNGARAAVRGGESPNGKSDGYSPLSNPTAAPGDGQHQERRCRVGVRLASGLVVEEVGAPMVSCRLSLTDRGDSWRPICRAPSRRPGHAHPRFPPRDRLKVSEAATAARGRPAQEPGCGTVAPNRSNLQQQHG